MIRKWWKEKVVYQIYPRSYKDTNGDGIGDIAGIIEHLDDLKDLGVGILWISPLYKSPNRDNGYDISDYKDINPEFGTMRDMDLLIEAAAKRDIKLVMDLVINHTSDQHMWFQESRDKESPYRDYYIWKKGKSNGKPPNNWTTFFAEDAWTYDEMSEEYYLHLFAKEQPDLNYNNPKVLEEVEDIMKFWLDKGISGFRCDVINILFKQSLEDGRKKLVLTGDEHYISKQGTHEILKKLRKNILDHYDCFTVGETVFVTPQMGHDLCDPSRKELDMIFSFEHMETDQYIVKWFPRKFSSKRFAKTISKWQKELDWNSIYLENHDQPRCVSRFGDDTTFWEESAKMLSIMLFSLRGTPYVYQGQEIGMTNFDFDTMDKVKDIESHNVYKMAQRLHVPKSYRWKMIKKASRDNARTPVQWNSETNAGFTTGMPWLRVNRNYTRINMRSQMYYGNSVRNFYKSAIALRASSDTLIYGDYEEIYIDNQLFVYKRSLDWDTTYTFLNFSKKDVDLSKVMLKCNLDGYEILLDNYNSETVPNQMKPYQGFIAGKKSVNR